MTPRRLIEPARLAGSTMLRTQTDARLVDLVRAGHSAAFEAIVQRYRQPLLTYCSRVLPAARAEDAVQQTFLSAYQAMTRDDAELKLRPWLYRIARNTSLNLLRQNGWTHDQLSENFDGVERPDQVFERREQLRSAVDAVNALPERQRDALVQRELEGKRYDEIAAALGVNDGAVRQLLHRARATLRGGASALTPVGLLERIADLAGGAGGAGAVKFGAALLATGAIAGGTLATPIARHHPPTPRHTHVAAAPEKPRRAPVRTVAERVAPAAAVVVHRAPRHEAHHHRSAGKGSGSDHSGPGRGGSDDQPVTGERKEGDDQGGSEVRDNSGPGSGSAEPTTTTTPLTEDHSGSGDASGDSSGSGSSGKGSGGGGGDGGSSGDSSSGSGSDDGH